MDTAVFMTQQWLNKTYTGKNGYTPVTEDGRTGWSTMKRLTTALQIEMGISTPNGNFGPATSKAFENLSIGSSKINQVYILQGALFCKGYNPGGFNGKFSEHTKAAIMKLQSDAGLPNQDGVVNSLLMKALLTMDAFVILNWGGYHGDPNIRAIQKYLNRDYISNQCFARDIGLVPCDGIYGRSTNKALLYALQIEEGISSPNGVFGPTTKSKCPVLSPGSGQSKFICLLKYALYCNGFNTNGFDGQYGDSLKATVADFQKFCGINVTGIADLQTWASLLVSTGDKTRKGTMCDCSTTITPAKAQTLVKNGYISVGRYLTGKFKMTNDELHTIFSAGLKVFPILETGGYKLSYFNSEQGTKDAEEAIKVTSDFGFKENTIIYFTVDFDALDGDVTSSILPYFKSIHQVFSNSASRYRVGIYAPRNVCSRVSDAGYSCSSFVCDMSSGFSGNLGYPLPKDWAIDQISTINIGSGEGQIEIDNNISSGRDLGSNFVIHSGTSSTDKPFIKIGKVVTSVSFLNVRNGASTSNEKIGTLNPNDEVFVISQEGEWYKINFNNGYGYVYSSYINITYSASEKIFIKKGKVVDSVSFLNVRNGASTSNAKIGTLKPNDEVSIIAQDGDWYRIEFNGGYGFVYSNYITILKNDGGDASATEQDAINYFNNSWLAKTLGISFPRIGYEKEFYSSKFFSLKVALQAETDISKGAKTLQIINNEVAGIQVKGESISKKFLEYITFEFGVGKNIELDLHTIFSKSIDVGHDNTLAISADIEYKCENNTNKGIISFEGQDYYYEHDGVSQALNMVISIELNIDYLEERFKALKKSVTDLVAEIRKEFRELLALNHPAELIGLIILGIFLIVIILPEEIIAAICTGIVTLIASILEWISTFEVVDTVSLCIGALINAFIKEGEAFFNK